MARFTLARRPSVATDRHSWQKPRIRLCTTPVLPGIQSSGEASPLNLPRLAAIPLQVVGFLCALAMARPVHAGKWPMPAAGVSASGDPELVLTFDDGPHEKYTPIILDALKAHQYQAVFFWTGARVTHVGAHQEERLAIVERAVQAGHLIGNHTISHAKLCSVSKKQAESEIDDNTIVYENLTGMPLSLLRVPYGARCRRLDKILSQRGLAHMHWDLDPQEFLHHSSDIAFSYVTKRLRRLTPGKRVVLLMHDTKPATARAIPKILNWIDTENAKRISRGKRPIRVIPPSQWFEEAYPAPLLRWAQASGQSSSDSVFQALRKLTL